MGCFNSPSFTELSEMKLICKIASQWTREPQPWVIVACMTFCKLIQVAFHGFQSTRWVGFPLHGGERELVIFRSRKLQSSRFDSLGPCLDDVTCNKMMFFFSHIFCSFFFWWLGGRGGGEYRRRYFPEHGWIANQDGSYSFKDVGSLPKWMQISEFRGSWWFGSWRHSSCFLFLYHILLIHTDLPLTCRSPNGLLGSRP